MASRAGTPAEGTWETQARDICGPDKKQREENGGVCNEAQMNPETHE